MKEQNTTPKIMKAQKLFLFNYGHTLIDWQDIQFLIQNYTKCNYIQ